MTYKRKTNIMKLTQTIIGKLTSDRTMRLKVAVALNFSEQWTDRLITANKDNGPLTTAKSIKVIREETGLEDSQILEEETVAVK